MTRSTWLAVINQLALDHRGHVWFFCPHLQSSGHDSSIVAPNASSFGSGGLFYGQASASFCGRALNRWFGSLKLLWLAVFVAMSRSSSSLDRWQFPTGFPLEFSYFALSALSWIVLPAVPLLLGTLPFLREPNLSRAQTN